MDQLDLMLRRGVTTKFKFEYEVQVVKQVLTLVIKSIQLFRLNPLYYTRGQAEESSLDLSLLYIQEG